MLLVDNPVVVGGFKSTSQRSSVAWNLETTTGATWSSWTNHNKLKAATVQGMDDDHMHKTTHFVTS